MTVTHGRHDIAATPATPAPLLGDDVDRDDVCSTSGHTRKGHTCSRLHQDLASGFEQQQNALMTSGSYHQVVTE